MKELNRIRTENPELKARFSQSHAHSSPAVTDRVSLGVFYAHREELRCLNPCVEISSETIHVSVCGRKAPDVLLEG